MKSDNHINPSEVNESLINKKSLEYEKEKDNNIKIFKIIIYSFGFILLSLGIFLIFLSYNNYITDYDNQLLSQKIVERESQYKTSLAKNNKEMIKLHMFIEYYSWTDVTHPDIFQMILNWIPSTNSNKSLRICFNSNSFKDNKKEFMNRCMFYSNLLIIIKADDGSQFGGYVNSDKISTDIDTFIEDPEAFLFSIDKKEKYKVKDPKKAFKLLSEGFFIFGDEDLVINNDFYASSACLSKFPSNYEGSSSFLNKRSFGIIEMEIFNIYER